MGDLPEDNVTTCCSDCFAEAALRTLLERTGTRGRSACPRCGSNKGALVDVDGLRDMFRAVIKHEYMLVEELSQAAHIDPVEAGDPLEVLLQDDFALFAEEVSDQRGLLLSILTDDRHSRWEGLWCRREDDALEWTVGDYWSVVSHEARSLGHSLIRGVTFCGSDAGRRAYEVIRELLGTPQSTLGKESLLWRARRGAGITNLGAPPPEKARAARVNLQGQPVLYVADSRRTAVYEVRPSVGEVVTVGQFELVRDVKVCDLTPDFEYCSPFSEDPDALDRYEEVSRDAQTRVALGRLLATPVTPEDEARDYIPTQLLARLVESLGYDGIKFPSAQRRNPQARNFAFFDPRIAVTHGEAHEIQVEAIHYSYELRRRGLERVHG